MVLGIIEGQPPSIKQVGQFAKDILESYDRELGDTQGYAANAEIVITGYCPQENDFVICHIGPSSPEGPFPYEVSSFSSQTTHKEHIIQLGDAKDEISSVIDEYRHTAKNDLYWWRAPANVIHSCAIENSYDTIGGNLQLGIGNKYRFRLFSIVEPFKNLGPARMNYLGFDLLREHKTLGDCFAGVSAMYLFK